MKRSAARAAVKRRRSGGKTKRDARTRSSGASAHASRVPSSAPTRSSFARQTCTVSSLSARTAGGALQAERGSGGAADGIAMLRALREQRARDQLGVLGDDRVMVTGNTDHAHVTGQRRPAEQG